MTGSFINAACTSSAFSVGIGALPSSLIVPECAPRHADTSSGRVSCVERRNGRGISTRTIRQSCGRPRGLATLAREAAGDGRDLIDFYVAVLTGDTKVLCLHRITLRDLLAAAAWLRGRGWGRCPLSLIPISRRRCAERRACFPRRNSINTNWKRVAPVCILSVPE
jgi:hypothetical protein